MQHLEGIQGHEGAEHGAESRQVAGPEARDRGETPAAGGLRVFIGAREWRGQVYIPDFLPAVVVAVE